MIKKMFVRLMSVAALTVISVTASSYAAPASAVVAVNAPATDTKDPARLLERLQQIRDMDKSALTSAERKQLRKEVKGIKKEMREVGRGVYLSVGAIIIIILLLILIL
jgi:hypothetical protein